MAVRQKLTVDELELCEVFRIALDNCVCKNHVKNLQWELQEMHGVRKEGEMVGG
jgi:hypothetical protein